MAIGSTDGGGVAGCATASSSLAQVEVHGVCRTDTLVEASDLRQMSPLNPLLLVAATLGGNFFERTPPFGTKTSDRMNRYERRTDKERDYESHD